MKMRIEYESKMMKFFRYFGFESIAWSLRKLYCPVSKNDLVLEVGSGGSPYFRSNVLCDAFEESEERFFAPLILDRPMVISFVENLPFKDNSFDFVIASHVLEHSSDPERFLSEIQRVAKSGYIEVPDAFMERLTHYGFHKLEITDKNNELLIRKKKHYIEDPEVVDLFHNKARGIFPKWASLYPFNFHVRYYWSKDEGGIKYKIINPEVELSWNGPNYEFTSEELRLPLKARIKNEILKLVRTFFSQNSRNKEIDLTLLMRCTKCGGTEFAKSQNKVICKSCKEEFKVFRSN